MKLVADPIRSQELFKHIEGMIKSGDLEPGQRLPSLRVLSKQYETSVTLVRRCFCQLENKGLLIQKHGSGTFINPALKYKGTKLVALLTSYHKQDIEGYFEPLFDAVNSANVVPIISTLDYSKNWQANISKVIEREPDAVMIDVEAKHYPMQKIRKLLGDTPHCFVNRWEWDKLEPFSAVIVDYIESYGKALKYLKDRGHKKILVLAYHIKTWSFMEKFLNGAAEIADMSFDNELVYYSYEQFNQSEKSLKTVCDQCKPTAIFGLSDHIVHEIIERGAEFCPEIGKLDKLGFYDLKYSQLPGHEFSSMKVDFGEIWQNAFNMLNTNTNSVCKIVPELIQR